jgi:nicotinamidase-related amidase
MNLDKFTLRKEDCLLLIIDIQDRLAAVMEYKKKIIKNAKVLLKASELMDIPIIITEQYPRGLGSTVNELVDDGIEIHKKIEKTQFSAYTEEVKTTLKNLDKKKIIVTGMETHVCVFQTIRDLLNEGYEVYLVNDGVTSRSKEDYLNGIDLMKQMGAIIVNTETILFDLLKDSNVSEFKTISKMVK